MSANRSRWIWAVAFVTVAALSIGCGASQADGKGAGKAGADSTAVAKIGDQVITSAELDEEVRKVDMKAYQAYYDARKKVLDQMIAKRLIDAELAERGISEQELQAEITSGVQPVTDAEVQAFFNQNQAQMGGRGFDQVSGQIRNYLTQQRTGSVMSDFMADLRKRRGAEIMLEPPRMDVKVAANDPKKGPNDAPIQLVEFSDFQCPYCSRVGPTIQRVMETYGDKVQLVFRDYPLGFHDKAQISAEAANCANEQGKFWEYHDKLFANQKALDRDNLVSYAKELSLDESKFTACLDSNKYAADVQQDMADGVAVGVGGTPAFFINGRFLNGAQPYEAFVAVIEEELARAGAL